MSSRLDQLAELLVQRETLATPSPIVDETPGVDRTLPALGTADQSRTLRDFVHGRTEPSTRRVGSVVPGREGADEDPGPFLRQEEDDRFPFETSSHSWIVFAEGSGSSRMASESTGVVTARKVAARGHLVGDAGLHRSGGTIVRAHFPVRESFLQERSAQPRKGDRPSPPRPQLRVGQPRSRGADAAPGCGDAARSGRQLGCGRQDAGRTSPTPGRRDEASGRCPKRGQTRMDAQKRFQDPPGQNGQGSGLGRPRSSPRLSSPRYGTAGVCPKLCFGSRPRTFFSRQRPF